MKVYVMKVWVWLKEHVGVAYRACGCGLQLGMHCDV